MRYMICMFYNMIYMTYMTFIVICPRCASLETPTFLGTNYLEWMCKILCSISKGFKALGLSICPYRTASNTWKALRTREN